MEDPPPARATTGGLGAGRRRRQNDNLRSLPQFYPRAVPGNPGSPRLAAFGAIAEIAAFHQHGGITKVAQDSEARRMNAAIGRSRNRREIALDRRGQIEGVGRMIIWSRSPARRCRPESLK